MRWLIAGLALVVSTTAALAQMSPQQTQMDAAGRVGHDASRKFDEKDNKPKANDKAYDAALKNLPDKRYDPWHGVR
jgi:hypothetical protein